MSLFVLEAFCEGLVGGCRVVTRARLRMSCGCDLKRY